MDQSAFERYFELEKKHFWRMNKRLLVRSWMERYFGVKASPLKILDIGGCCSLIPTEMKKWGDLTVVEPEEQMLKIARQNAPDIQFLSGALPDNLPDGNYDLITAFDVVEHVEEDTRSLENIAKHLEQGGFFFATVPTYMWLWSDHDVSLHHKRRYSYHQFKSLIEDAGFEIVRMTFFTTLLFPVVVAERMLKKLRPAQSTPQYNVKTPHPIINTLFLGVMFIERVLLRFFNFPFGSSLMVLARKK